MWRCRETTVYVVKLVTLKIPLCSPVRSVSPVVEVTPVYSGDTSAVGELAEDTPTEWTDRAGEYDSGDGEAGFFSVSVNSCSLSVEGEKGGDVTNWTFSKYSFIFFYNYKILPVSQSQRSEHFYLYTSGGSGLTCAALALHGSHKVIGPLLAVQGFQQVKHIIIKHKMDQVEGPCRRFIQRNTC